MNDIINYLKEAIALALKRLGVEGVEIELEIPKEKANGDYSTNVAMKLARVLRKAPLLIANDIKDALELDQEKFEKVEVANPGFINFYLKSDHLSQVVFKILDEKEHYGSSNVGKAERVLLEFVSANPTGYLHVGHGRGAAFGDSLARIMRKAGYDVSTEHYVNDAGNQMNNMAHSVYARYMELYGKLEEIGEDGYHGKEIITVAKLFQEEYGDKYVDKYDQELFREFGKKILLGNLQSDLAKFNVKFDNWFSETSLYQNGDVAATIQFLKDNNYTYEQDGALWLKTTLLNDEKDRVIIKSDGSYTYLLPDIAYHNNKFKRGFKSLIDVLGSDHYGYIDRLKASIWMMGNDPEKLDVELLQIVRVMQNGEEIKMSKRSGKAITLTDLIDEVGSDALRYFYVDKALSSHMDLDLSLMLAKSNDNPVYYSQYAHARIASIFRKYGKEFVPCDSFKLIDQDKIKDLTTILDQYPKLIAECATKHLVHKLTHYIYDLSKALHAYYNDEKIISDDEALTIEKLTLMKAVQIVLKDALSLIGVSAPDKME